MPTLTEQFNDIAQKIMNFAEEESVRLKHEYLSTEHVILGILEDLECPACKILRDLKVDLVRFKKELQKLIQSGNNSSDSKRMQTPRLKKVIFKAFEEARNLKDTKVGTEHLLLALIREAEGVAGFVFESIGVKYKEVKNAIIRDRGQMPEERILSTIRSVVEQIVEEYFIHNDFSVNVS